MAYRKPLRRNPDAMKFGAALSRLREAVGWSQSTLAARLGVSLKTVSNWEVGYWLPPPAQRAHLVVTLHGSPHAELVAVAETLGVRSSPAVAVLLDAQRPRAHKPLAPGLRAAVDAAILTASDALNARPNDVRSAVLGVLEACASLGATLADAQQAVVPREGAKGQAK